MSENYKLDKRSQKNIVGLHEELQKLAILLVEESAKADIEIKITSGLRTYVEQDELFALGRTKPGNIVTRKKGGESNHNFGLAFDIGVFKNNDYIPESNEYLKVGKIGESLGLTWGGSWMDFPDYPHFELRPVWAKNMDSETYLAHLRIKIENNEDLLS